MESRNFLGTLQIPNVHPIQKDGGFENGRCNPEMVLYNTVANGDLIVTKCMLEGGI